MSKKIYIWTGLILMLLGAIAGNANSDFMIDGVPIPADAKEVSAKTSDSPFAGTWVGQWDGIRKTILIVEEIDDKGNAKVVYAIADSLNSARKRAWFRLDGKIKKDQLQVFAKGFTLAFSLSATGRMRAVFGQGFSFAVMSRQKLTAITKPGTNIKWDVGTSQLLQTNLNEDGKQIELEVVIYKPAGEGPFPLAVVNHGSTGNGLDETAFASTWTNPYFAGWLNEKGWIVAFPQRRGRGKSDGLYDEGFAVDRSKGYTCEKNRSLVGAERALEDIEAAVTALRKRPDVNDAPVLLAGHSRGGILSLTYAGQYPGQIKGVVNIVGGWLGERCEMSEQVNQELFRRGGAFSKPTLWLYGANDVYYSLTHSKKNFEAFRNAGGVGTFKEVKVRGENNGHWVMFIPPLWTAPLNEYLDAIGG